MATSAPLAPVATVCRTFIGDNQFTVCETITPLPNRPVATTMSSCSRPERCVTCAATCAYDDPAIDRLAGCEPSTAS